jgi:hypothetical protein
VQEHITGLPEEVASTPFGSMIITMLQPAMEQRFGSATATRFEPSRIAATNITTVPAHMAQAAPKDAGSDGQSHGGVGETTAQRNASPVCVAAAQVVEAVEQMQAGADAEPVCKAFHAALAEEFERVKSEEGFADVNHAGAEAMKRVMLLVRKGVVASPSHSRGGPS